MEIIVNCDGDYVSWKDGVFNVPEKFKNVMKQNLLLEHKEILLYPDGHPIQVGTDSLVGILALFFSFTPGRCSIIKIPKTLENSLNKMDE